MSLRWRVAGWTAAVALGIHLVLGFLAVAYQHHVLGMLFDSRLINRAQLVYNGIASIEGAWDDAHITDLVSGPLFFSSPEGYIVALYDQDGHAVASTRRPVPELATVLPPGLTPGREPLVQRISMPALTIEGDTDDHARVLVQALPPDTFPGRSILIATTDTTFEQMMGVAAQNLIGAVLLGTLATGAAAWLVAGYALRPLKQLSAMVRSFEPQSIRAATSVEPIAAELSGFQRELGAARDKLRDSLHAQDRLISNVSHEMKTPIAVLLAEAEMMDDATLSEEGRQFVRSVRQEMRRLAGTIETLTLLTHLRGGKPLPERGACDLAEAIVQAVSSCDPLARRHGVGVRVTASDDDDPPRVWGDGDLLASMFTQVLSSSLRSSPRGAEIEVSMSVLGERCLVTVRDCGLAVPSDRLATMFDRYPSDAAHAREPRELGLSIAQGIAELHGGSISVVNIDGGREFCVNLPAMRAGTEADAGERPGMANGATSRGIH